MSKASPVTAAPHLQGANVAIIRAEWNGHITGPLRDSAVSTLRAAGIPDTDIRVYDVPGAVELVHAAALVGRNKPVDAVIVFGCVVRGDTPHFDYVCQSVTQGVTELNARGPVPVIFGVLTCNTEQEALDRIAGGSVGDKGAEAAEAALKMIALARRLR